LTVANSLSLYDDAGAPTVASSRARATEAPVLIEVRGVEKTFRIPTHRVDTLKERVIHPLRNAEYRELRALRDISFEVRQGEFFGIVGRNGSGKSTLLKILSSIYRADAGTIRMAGRLAPFIELGVGFNHELTARENVALNGVMMGLSRREAASRLDAVLEFAELREFVDLKLKNYSSGMMVRLAFAVMVEADADIMLIDEVLAVGDASFAQKCMDVFRQKRRAGKTLVLVTHDMATVQGFCDRAMLIHDGELRYIGDPEEAALRYFRLNFGGVEEHNGAAPGGAVPDVNVKLIDVWLENQAGERVENVEQGEPIGFHLIVEARHELTAAGFGFQVLNGDGVPVFGFGKTMSEEDEEPDRIAAGQRIHIAGKLENPLVPGDYTMSCSISRGHTPGDLALRVPELVTFGVRGTGPAPVAIEEYEVGMVSVRTDVEAVVERSA
jgi:ABC-type polysaccharide/polyol phosphate transport system ATPase subunit